MPADPYPLTDQHCAALDCTLQSCAQTKGLLEKCKACGIPCEAFEETNTDQQKLAAAIKANFFPNRP